MDTNEKAIYFRKAILKGNSDDISITALGELANKLFKKVRKCQQFRKQKGKF